MKHYVGIVLVKKDGSVLAQLRDDKPNIDYPNLWSTVGGLKKAKEAPNKAGIRELKEETNYFCKEKDLQILTSDTFRKPDGETVRRTIFWAWYDAKQDIHTNEGQEIRFLSAEELKTLQNLIDVDTPIFKLASEKAFNYSNTGEKT